MGRRVWRGLVAIAMLATPAAVQADELTATRGQLLSEVSHSVDISIANGVATYKVRRQFANLGKVADEAGLAIDLPAGAAATGLRIRAHDRWYDGELMERGAAAALYQEMTGFGAHAPKDPALLQWQWADKLYLQVFPVMPGAVSTVEYTLTVPTRYAAGKYWLSYPRVDAAASASASTAAGSRPLATPTVTMHPAWGDATTLVSVDGQRVAPDTTIVLVPPARQPWEDVVPAESGASSVASSLEVPASKATSAPVSTVSLMLDIAHTYQGDLEVVLVTPQHQVIPLMERAGGGTNALRSTRTLALPSGTTAAGTWRLIASDHAGLDTGSIDQWSLAFGTGKAAVAFAAADVPVFIPDAPEHDGEAGVATISVEPPVFTTWQGRYGRVIASTEHAFGRLEVDVAPRLSTVPAHAQIVFVIDTSFSAGDAHVDAQLAILSAYLAHVPDAVVEVVTYRRHATRVFGAFVPAADVRARLAAAHAVGAFALGNGSALDEGAALATQLLANRSGPRRLVMLTDELVRSSLSTPLALAALAKLSPDTVVHVVVPQLVEDSHPTLDREDANVLSPLATKHRGILARISGLPAQAPKDLVPVVLELVRPTRIDNLAVTGATVDIHVLHEGDGIRLFEHGAMVAPRVVLRGELWSVPVTRTLETTPAFARSTAAFVFGADEHQDLSPEEMMRVALQGRAVSPVTSYVAAEPGTRPSTIGFLTGHGSGSGSGYCSGGGMLRKPHRQAPDLASLISASACVAQYHPAAGWLVHLDVETTRAEIVDVATADPSPFAHCLAETIWTLELDARFDLPREQFAIALKAP